MIPVRRTEYQHYVPRFILKNFATNPPQDKIFTILRNGRATGARLPNIMRKRNKTRHINVYHIKENRLDLASEQTDNIRRNFGIPDMYIDYSHHDPNDIEVKFSRLENDAAIVVKQLVEAAQDPKPHLSVCLNRKQLNTLRKFLFTLNYRQISRATQFIDERFDTLMRPSIAKHIAENMANKSARGRDVWLQNIREVLDSEVWEIPKNKKIYIHDRIEYVTDMRERRLFLWRTTGKDEFIMCDSGFGFFDGCYTNCDGLSREVLEEVHILRQNPDTENTGVHMWVRLYPVAPHLALVLADRTLCKFDTDAFLENMRTVYRHMGYTPSRFCDFPFARAQPTDYRNLSNDARKAKKQGNLKITCSNPVLATQSMLPSDSEPGSFILSLETFLDGRITQSREEDVFTFPVAQLTSDQVKLVNGLVLENARNQLTFRSTERLYSYIRAYEKAHEEGMWHKDKDWSPLKRTLLSLNRCIAQHNPARLQMGNTWFLCAELQDYLRNTVPVDRNYRLTGNDCC